MRHTAALQPGLPGCCLCGRAVLLPLQPNITSASNSLLGRPLAAAFAASQRVLHLQFEHKVSGLGRLSRLGCGEPGDLCQFLAASQYCLHILTPRRQHISLVDHNTRSLQTATGCHTQFCSANPEKAAPDCVGCLKQVWLYLTCEGPAHSLLCILCSSSRD